VCVEAIRIRGFIANRKTLVKTAPGVSDQSNDFRDSSTKTAGIVGALDAIARLAQRGSPFGERSWLELTAKWLGLAFTLCPWATASSLLRRIGKQWTPDFPQPASTIIAMR